jgi:hypothetical protein
MNQAVVWSPIRKRILHLLSTKVLQARVTESASRPPSGFWCLNDKTIKELMTFAKCVTGKMSYKL